MPLSASISLVRSPLTAPLLDGAVSLPSATLTVNEAKSVNRNSQEMVSGTYDIGEMSLATYFKAREDGLPFVGLPVFTGRRFVHSGIHTRPGAGLSTAGDLAGRRVCLPQYWMTSSVWHRVLLSQEYGVGPEQVRWVTTGRERLNSAGYPPGVEITLAEGRLPGELLAEGDVDAVMVPKRGGRMIGGIDYETPFPDVVAAQRASFAKTGVFPIMHFIVIRGEAAEAAPSLAPDLCEAFSAAKAFTMSDPARRAEMEPPIWGEPVEAALPLFGGDPWPYGIASNRKTLETFQSCLIEQGLVSRAMPLEALFAPYFDSMEAAR